MTGDDDREQHEAVRRVHGPADHADDPGRRANLAVEGVVGHRESGDGNRAAGGDGEHDGPAGGAPCTPAGRRDRVIGGRRPARRPEQRLARRIDPQPGRPFFALVRRNSARPGGQPLVAEAADLLERLGDGEPGKEAPSEAGQADREREQRAAPEHEQAAVGRRCDRRRLGTETENGHLADPPASGDRCDVATRFRHPELARHDNDEAGSDAVLPQQLDPAGQRDRVTPAGQRSDLLGRADREQRMGGDLMALLDRCPTPRAEPRPGAKPRSVEVAEEGLVVRALRRPRRRLSHRTNPMWRRPAAAPTGFEPVSRP